MIAFKNLCKGGGVPSAFIDPVLLPSALMSRQGGEGGGGWDRRWEGGVPLDSRMEMIPNNKKFLENSA